MRKCINYLNLKLLNTNSRIKKDNFHVEFATFLTDRSPGANKFAPRENQREEKYRYE